MGFLLLVLLFSFSRSECPCPKTFTGRECYDEDEHFNVGDFDIRPAGGVRALFVRFRAIKQDKRVERPEAQGDGDWAVLGEIRGSRYCPVQWFIRLQPFYGHRPDVRGPFFLDEDGRRPLLYGKALDGFKDLQRAVGVPEDELAGLHGLRVEGHNNTKNGLGDGLAQAHGLWKSQACRRYDRFTMDQVVRIPAVIVGADDGDDIAPTNEARERGPPSARLRRGDLQPDPSPSQPGPGPSRSRSAPSRRPVPVASSGGQSAAVDEGSDAEEDMEAGGGLHGLGLPHGGSIQLHAHSTRLNLASLAAVLRCDVVPSERHDGFPTSQNCIKYLSSAVPR